MQILEDAWKQHLRPRPKDAPTVISAFAGCGGSSLGYSMAGFRELLAIEWNDNAVATFQVNFPAVPIYHGDITELTIEQCLKTTNLQPGELDVLDGSPPCQGFSTSGKRMIDDPRNQLFHEYVRLLRGLQPKVFVMENVSGMIKGKMKLIFAEIMQELKDSGYKVKAWLMNAQYFNVPQSRQRVIFIGVRQDLEIEPSQPKAQSNLFSFRNAVEGLVVSEQIPEIDHVWVNEVERKTKWITIAKNLKPGQKLISNKPTGIRLYWNKPSPTIQKNAPEGSPPYVRNSLIHPTEARTPSIREMARCQSFPDQFRFVDALHNGMHRIGNSVPPLFMKAIAEHIKSTVFHDL